MRKLTRWRVREQELVTELPPITIAYYDTKGGILHGFCKTPSDWQRTRQAGTDQAEDQYFCLKCIEHFEVPHAVLSRLRVWVDSPESVLTRDHDGHLVRSSSDHDDSGLRSAS